MRTVKTNAARIRECAARRTRNPNRNRYAVYAGYAGESKSVMNEETQDTGGLPFNNRNCQDTEPDGAQKLVSEESGKARGKMCAGSSDAAGQKHAPLKTQKSGAGR